MCLPLLCLCFTKRLVAFSVYSKHICVCGLKAVGDILFDVSTLYGLNCMFSLLPSSDSFHISEVLRLIDQIGQTDRQTDRKNRKLLEERGLFHENCLFLNFGKFRQRNPKLFYFTYYLNWSWIFSEMMIIFISFFDVVVHNNNRIHIHNIPLFWSIHYILQLETRD